MPVLAIAWALITATASGEAVVPAPDPPAAGEATDDTAFDAPMIAALQLGAACGTYAVGTPLLAISSYGCGFLACGLCLLPAAAGYVGTWVGDRYGSSRAPAIWPMVAAYAGLAISVVGTGIIYWGALTGGSPVFVLGGAAGILAGLGASAAGVPVAYALSAEEKHPWDDGSELPGILSAAHPAAAPAQKRRAPSSPAPAPRPPAPELPELPTPPLLEPLGLLGAMPF